jgi:hypothetical protein
LALSEHDTPSSSAVAPIARDGSSRMEVSTTVEN